MAIGTGLRAIKPFLIFKLCRGQFFKSLIVENFLKSLKVRFLIKKK